jgi:endonuclease YncB( thermonuclease family)
MKLHSIEARPMVKRVIAAAVMAMAAGLTLAAGGQAPARGTGALNITGPVRVIDGDTIEVYVGGGQIGAGLIGIKAPPGNTACGKKAARFLETLINQLPGGTGPESTLRFDEDLDITFDARKRRMYYLMLPGGISAAAELVRAGLAEPDGTGNEKVELSAAAAQAPKCTL